MKRIILAVALIAASISAGAQPKTAVKSKDATIASVTKAEAAAQKKPTKYASWLKLGQAYMDAFEAPKGPAWVGAGKAEVDLLLGSVKPIKKKDQVEVSGQNMSRYYYPTCNYYYNDANALAMIEITAPYVENALGKALDAYKKAYELDASGAKTKDISAAIEKISQQYNETAYNAYGMNRLQEAAENFEKAFNVSLVEPYAKVDTGSLFNAAVTRSMMEDFASAKVLFEKCVDYNYEYKGEVYSKLAEIATKDGDAELSKDWLEKGFVKFPENQGILVGLINYYLNAGDGNTDRLFELLDIAKKNEPGNASLWYVEGNIYGQLGRQEEAVKSYRHCVEVDPTYVYGFIGEGLLYYKQATDIAEKAQNEMDDAKYMAMVKEFEGLMKSCIEPFETAFNKTSDDTLKVSLADYLKSCYYRFVSDSQEYKDAYDKYNKIVKEGL